MLLCISGAVACGCSMLKRKEGKMKRLETGIVQDGDDWPAVFIRGDSALMGYAPALEAVLKGKAGPVQETIVSGLLNLLKRCDARTAADVQKFSRKS